MRWEEIDSIAEALGGGWKMVRRPPPADAVWVVKKSLLDDAEVICGREPQPAVYLAARAEGQWFVLGKVRPSGSCISVTFYRLFPSARRAVEALVDYGKRIFDFFPPQFDIEVIRAAGLCSRIDFAEYCEKAGKPPKRPVVRPAEAAAVYRTADEAAGGAVEAAFQVRLDVALRCLFKTLGLEVEGCDIGVGVDFETMRCWVAGLLKGGVREWERCVKGHA